MTAILNATRSTFVAATATSTTTLAFSLTTSATTTALSTGATVALIASTSASTAVVITTKVVLALAVLLNFRLVNGWLVSDIGSIARLFAQSDLKHGDDTCKLKMVKAFLKWLVLIYDSDVADRIELV